MTDRKRLAALAAYGILINLVYYYVAQVLLWSYPLKAIFRVVFFLGLPLFDWLVLQRLTPAELWRRLAPKRSQLRGLLLGLLAGSLAVAVIGLLGLPLLRRLGFAADFGSIVENTGKSEGSLFFFLLYLPLVNALIEEIFFRAYLYLEIARRGWEVPGTVFAALLFALYHLSVVRGWMGLPLVLLMLAGLFAAGLLLNRILRRQGHVFGVWIIHGLFNFLTILLSLQVVR
jgi:uncharacterized protein